MAPRRQRDRSPLRGEPLTLAAEPRHPLILEREITTDEELWWLVRYLFGVEIPRVAVCAGHVAPFRAFADAFYRRHPVILVKASRGLAGKTFLFATLAATEAAYLGAGVSLLGGSLEQSQLAHEYTSGFWDTPGFPGHLLTGDPTARETELGNGGRLRVLAASTKSVRGKHEPRLRLDEADEMKKFVLESALGQPMPQPGVFGPVRPQTLIGSTHHYADGTFTYLLNDLAPQKGWKVYEWCYREAHVSNDGGWLEEATIEDVQATVPAHMWRVEYELQEPSFEGRAIDEDKIDVLFDRELGEFEGDEGEIIEIEPPKPGATYAHGADWARTQDWTILTVFRTDVRPWRCVRWVRLGRRPWPDMVRRFDEALRRYPPGVERGDAYAQTDEKISAAHDATGLGDVVDDYIEYRPRPTAVKLVGQTRANILSDYVAAIEAEAVRYPFIKWAEREHRYAAADDLFGRGHPPDSIVSGALSWAVRDTNPTPIAGPAGIARSTPSPRS